jgi:plastocyanin
VTRKLLIIAPLLATAAIAAGCGGTYNNDTTSSPPAKSAATTEPAAPAAEAEATTTTEVKMAGSTFAPATIDMKVGETITFVNDDEIAHTATAGDGTFDSGTMDPGATFDFTAETAGEISYVCTFHPGMTGTINVT